MDLDAAPSSGMLQIAATRARRNEIGPVGLGNAPQRRASLLRKNLQGSFELTKGKGRGYKFTGTEPLALLEQSSQRGSHQCVKCTPRCLAALPLQPIDVPTPVK